MSVIIRNVRDFDIDPVLSLNQAEVPHVGSVDEDRMRWFAEFATCFRVAVMADRVAAYLVGFLPGSEYDSPNYRWFCDRYDQFAYIDRVAVAPFARRAGLASRLYDDFSASLQDGTDILTCEVNIRPPNPTSLEFHRRLGFEQVGTRASEDGDKEVAMLLKRIRPQ